MSNPQTFYTTINANSQIQDLSGIFQPISLGTAYPNLTGFKIPDGRDFNQIFAAGNNLGYSVGYKISNGTDLSQIFAKYNPIPFTISGTSNIDYTVTTVTPGSLYYIKILTSLPTFTALTSMNVTYTLVSGGFSGSGYQNQGGSSSKFYTAGGGGGGGGEVLNVTTPISLNASNNLNFSIGSGQQFNQSPGVYQNTSISGAIINTTNYLNGGKGSLGGYPTNNMNGSGGNGNAPGSFVTFITSNYVPSPPPSYSSSSLICPGGAGGAGSPGGSAFVLTSFNYFYYICGNGGNGLAGVDGYVYGGGGGGGAGLSYTSQYNPTYSFTSIIVTSGFGGNGGGGSGGNVITPTNGTSGAPNSGGGGGGGGGYTGNTTASTNGGSGGSGVIILKITI